MRSPSPLRLWLFLVALGAVSAPVLLGPTPAAHAQKIRTTTMVMKMNATVAPTGNARVQATVSFSPPQAYDRIKGAYPNLYVLFRDLGNERATSEIDKDTLEITPNDAKRSITFTANVLGYAVCKNSLWQVELQKGEDVVTQDGNKVFTSLAQADPGGMNTNGTTAYLLPAGAQNVQVDTTRRVLTYKMPAVAAKAGASAAPTVDVNVRCKKRLMSSLYKIYADNECGDGQYWVAKTVFKNTGKTSVHDLKISYRLGEYAELSTPERYSHVPAGGAVIAPYYPVIAARVTSLRTPTPVELYVKYEYKDAAGKLYSEENTQRVTISGVNQFEYSNLNEDDTTGSWKDNFNNARLLSAFVTKVDDPVKQFAGFVSEMAGGVAAASRDEDAMRWLKAAYELQRLNNIVYQTPSGGSGDFGQDIKLPRDVFRDKSGTCVDLAITYAALAEAVGLDANLMLVPGHCFAVVRLPQSGNLIAVENTGLGGGENRAPFEKAVEMGAKEFQDYVDKGLFYFVDVSHELSEGRIPNPELPALEATFLEKAGIKRVGGSAGFDGQWVGSLGNVELTLSLSEDNTNVKGRMMLRGSVTMNEDVSASVGKDSSIQIKKRTKIGDEEVEVELKGIRNGDSISGTFKITERLLFGIKGETVSGNWSAKRSWN